MPTTIRIGDRQATLTDGVWESSDRDLAAALNEDLALSRHRDRRASLDYRPYPDSIDAARVADRWGGEVVEDVRGDEDVEYPPGAVF